MSQEHPRDGRELRELLQGVPLSLRKLSNVPGSLSDILELLPGDLATGGLDLLRQDAHPLPRAVVELPPITYQGLVPMASDVLHNLPHRFAQLSVRRSGAPLPCLDDLHAQRLLLSRYFIMLIQQIKLRKEIFVEKKLRRVLFFRS